MTSDSTIVREFVVRNRHGVHARPAALFVKTASKFSCEITVERAGMAVSGKSIMGLLTLEGTHGVTLTVRAVGPDANAALDALQALVENSFKEE